ncbi:MAG: VirB4 family type IV secretion system protein [Acidimicrobiia bacterium]
MSGLSVRYLEDGLLVSRSAAWGWWRLELSHYELLSQGQRLARLEGMTGTLAGLREAECHLLSVPHTLDPAHWAEALDRATFDPAPGWAAYLSRQRAHVSRLGLARREVYLGVRLGERRREGVLSWRRRLEEAAGLSDVSPNEGELGSWRARAEVLSRLLCPGLPARPASGSEISVLIRRAFWRGIPDPLPLVSRSRSSGDELASLAEGTVVNGRRTLRLEQSNGSAPMTTLALARFPDALAFPGAEWLYLIDGFPFPVEASVRFSVVPAHRAASHANRKLAEATDQARHIAGTSAQLPLALAESLDRARELEYHLGKDPAPLAYTFARLVLSASDEDALERRAIEVTEAYRDLGIELVRPSGDQLALFLEAIPGERLKVRAYEQRQALVTLAGSMFAATSELGDGAGPYVGVTSSRTRVPVHFDPLWAAARNRPTTIAITGSPGAGKTTLSRLLMYQLALRGAWVSAVDPKGERGGLTELPGLPPVRTLTLGPEHAGLLNPFSLAESPGEAVHVAVSACQLLLPGRLDFEQSAVLLRAVAQEAEQNPVPTLSGVVERLAGSGEEHSRSLAQTLAVCATLPLARLCFPTPSAHSALSPEGVNLLRVDGLRAPEPGSPSGDWTLDQRLSVAVLYLLAQFLLRLFERTDPAQPKAVVLDEAWMLTATAQGRGLVPALARMGRSRNVAVLLVTQNASDLLGPEVGNNCDTRFCFRAGDEREIADVLRLLNVADTPGHRRRVRGLGEGECLFADLDGRVGAMRVDLMDDALRAAFDTTPARQRHREEVSA